ncbi:acyltransferase [bacterium]|nr:acyltransferase [bacterium]
MNLAVVQNSPIFGEIDKNIEQALSFIPTGADLAVLPELFATGYQFIDRDELKQFSEPIPNGKTCTALLNFASLTGCAIIAGLPEFDDGKIFNSSVLCKPDGTVETYRKTHLFWAEKQIFDPGDTGFPVQEFKGSTIGMMICFDWVFPEAARTLALGGAQLICHPSNLVLPFCPAAMITRSIENRIYTVTANRVGTEHRTGQSLTFIGQSQITGPGGDVLAALSDSEVGATTAMIDISESSKMITPTNDLFTDRRPEFYKLK